MFLAWFWAIVVMSFLFAAFCWKRQKGVFFFPAYAAAFLQGVSLSLFAFALISALIAYGSLNQEFRNWLFFFTKAGLAAGIIIEYLNTSLYWVHTRRSSPYIRIGDALLFFTVMCALFWGMSKHPDWNWW